MQMNLKLCHLIYLYRIKLYFQNLLTNHLQKQIPKVLFHIYLDGDELTRYKIRENICLYLFLYNYTNVKLGK